MVRRALAVAIALAAAAPPAYAVPLTWTDQSGDANLSGRRDVPGSQRAFDVVGARVETTRDGLDVQVDLVGRPSTLPGAAVWFTANRGGCTVLAQWVRSPVDRQPRAVTTCPGAAPYTTPVATRTRDHAVEIRVPGGALPGGTLTGVAVGTALADPVTGVAQVVASFDMSCYATARSRSGRDGNEVPSPCDARSSVS